MERPYAKRLLKALRLLVKPMRGIADALELMTESIEKLQRHLEQAEIRQSNRDHAILYLLRTALERRMRTDTTENGEESTPS